MRFFKLPFLFALLVGFVVSCDNEEDPVFEGNAMVQFQFDLKKSTGTVDFTNSGTLTFDKGSITIREIVFDGDRQGAPSVSISHEQIAIIDFSTGEVSPEVNVEIPAGEYKSVSLGIEIQDEGDAPTIIMEGEYTRTDGSMFPIRFEFVSGEVFEAEAESVSIASNIPAVAKITFDPVAWFSAVKANQLDNAKVKNDGIIVISESRNEAIFDLVADGLDRSTEAVFK